MRKKAQNLKRRAFTLVELVMVIVVLGIVSMIATDIIDKMYRGYLQTKIINDLEQKTEVLVDQIAKRLQYRIKPSMIARKQSTGAFLAMNSADLNSTNTDMVEWIGYDYESFIGEDNGVFSAPGWSGFIDVDNPNTHNTTGANGMMITPGSDLRIVDRKIKALSNNTAGIAGAFDKPAVIFKCAHSSNILSNYGWDYTKTDLADHNYTIEVSYDSVNIDRFNITSLKQKDTNRSVCEQYYLAWTAYALVPDLTMPSDDFNLTLRYNYQPWKDGGERYTNGTSVVLAEHVSTFRVMQVGETLRIKVCIQDGNITGVPVGFCKEKAIF